MLLHIFTNILVNKFVGNNLVLRFVKYLIKFPYYKNTCSHGYTDETSLSALNMFVRRLGTNKKARDHSADSARNFEIGLIK